MTRLQMLMALAAGASSATIWAQERPNVIFLVADDLGYGDLKCYGAKNVETPNADRVAAEGIRFTHCHATAATSTPSRYSLLTGQYAWRKPGTGVLPGDAALIIADDQYTVADMFHDNGYATAAIGKWHLGLGSRAGQQNWNGVLDHTPRHIGFDYHYIQAATADRVPCVYLEQDTIANYDPTSPIQVSYSQNFEGEPTGVTHRDSLKLNWTHSHNNSIVDGISRIGFMKGGGTALWKDENIADSIADHSRRFIREHKDEPFFMYLCTNDVHVPRWPHERFRGKNIMGLRGDAISSFDWTVGQVLEELDACGIADNTLLIITSDNGPVMDDGYDDKAFEKLNGHTPTAGRRGDKYSNYEGGTSVPFIVRWPNRVIPQAEENGTLLSLIDLFGSMGALIGAELPQGAAPDSGDMLAQILGESNEHRPWASELGQKNTICVRTDKWKYIPATSTNGALGWGASGHDGKVINTGDRTVVQLFDLENDPYETTNVADANPEVTKMMEGVWLDACDIVFVDPLRSTDSETHWYTLSTPLRDYRYLCENGSDLIGNSETDGYFPKAHWKFVDRADGTVNIINRADGKYIDPTSAPSSSSEVKLSVDEPSKGWKIDYANTHGMITILTADKSVQLNQTQSGMNYKIVNYIGGRSDTGCQFLATEVSGEPLAETAIPSTYAIPETSAPEQPKYYAIRSQRSPGVLTQTAAGLIGTSSTFITPNMVWTLELRPDGAIDLRNLAHNQYITPQTAANNSLLPADDSPQAGWTLKVISGTTYAISSGTVQLHQANQGNQYRIINYGGGNNTNDEGCKFRFTDITSLINTQDGIAETLTSQSASDYYFDLYGRRTLSPGHGIYIYQGKKIIL